MKSNHLQKMLTVGLVSMLTGCASLSGIGGSSNFSCKAPEGVMCDSISGVYANSVANNLPSQQVHRKAEQKEQSYAAAGYYERMISSGAPLRTRPRVLRIWVAPWEDQDGDLHDQSLAYVVVDNGRWLLEHNQRQIAQEYAPVRPPIGFNPSSNAHAAADSKPVGIDPAELMPAAKKGGDNAQ
jgi:conjugal transfer pilus assembly protein TraV